MGTALLEQFGILTALNCEPDFWIAAGCGLIVGILAGIIGCALYINFLNRE